jgi:hypothetical protein
LSLGIERNRYRIYEMVQANQTSHVGHMEEGSRRSVCVEPCPFSQTNVDKEKVLDRRNDSKIDISYIFWDDLGSILEFFGTAKCADAGTRNSCRAFSPSVARASMMGVHFDIPRVTRPVVHSLASRANVGFLCVAILGGGPTSVCDGYNNVSERAHRCLGPLKEFRRAQTAPTRSVPFHRLLCVTSRPSKTPPHQQPSQLHRTHSTHTYRLSRTLLVNCERKSGGATSPKVCNHFRNQDCPLGRRADTAFVVAWEAKAIGVFAVSLSMHGYARTRFWGSWDCLSSIYAGWSVLALSRCVSAYHAMRGQ